MPDDCALIAVGGYGRGELFPYSDVDILLLLPQAADKALEARLEAFIGRCWDMGLDIGSSVRTVDECISEAEQDVTVRTSLLEARLLTGDEGLYRTFETHYQGHLDAADFYQSKMLEMRQRHAKYQDTPYSLEPNCKESPGGLRDLQVILWMTRAAGFGSSWNELLANQLLTRREAKELAANERLLKTIRARLHLLAGRRQDVLVFDLQTQLGEAFGYRPNAAKRTSEQLMRRYYWAAKAVTQLNTVVLQNIEARLFPTELGITRTINAHFVERQGMLEIADPDLYQREPAAILETFLVYEQTRGVKGLAANTLRALYNARTLMDAKWRSAPANRATFLSILQQPQGITHALRLMNQTSVLGRYLVNFRRIVGQMPHDLFHVYTVDQRILMVVRNVRRFAIVESPRWRRPSRGWSCGSGRPAPGWRCRWPRAAHPRWRSPAAARRDRRAWPLPATGSRRRPARRCGPAASAPSPARSARWSRRHPRPGAGRLSRRPCCPRRLHADQ